MQERSTALNRVRSWLFVPGSNSQMIKKSKTIPADVLIFDLEDAVAPSEKETARQTVYHHLQEVWTQRILIRTNGFNSSTVLDEVLTLSVEPISGFVLPKVEEPDEVRCFSYLLDLIERRHGLESGHLRLVPILETAAGLSHVKEVICSSSRIDRVAFGSIDFSLDVGLAQIPTELQHYVRSTLVIESRAAGIGAPIDAVHADTKDTDGLSVAALVARDMGFAGKLAIHPSQIAILNQIFSATRMDLTEATEVVSAYEKALSEGKGTISVSGKMVDAPVYDLARKLLKEHS